MIKIILKR